MFSPPKLQARAELELPVVPRAGQHAVLHVTAHQRVALVRAAVVAGEHPARSAEQRDPLVQVGERPRAALGDVVDRRSAHPPAHASLHNSAK